MISPICGISKRNTNECTCKTETDSQIQKTNYWLPNSRGKREGKLEHKTNTYKIDKQRGYIIYHRELLPLSYNNF